MHPPARPDTYRSWLLGELVLVAVLALGTAALLVLGQVRGYPLPGARLALDTAVLVVASIVAVLAAVRHSVEGRLMDALLSGGFLAAALGGLVFDVLPALEAQGTGDPWGRLGYSLLGAALVAVAPFTIRRVTARRAVLGAVWAFVVLSLAGLAAALAFLELPKVTPESTAIVIGTGVLGILALVAAVGFGLRFRRFGRDLDSWLALALTLVVFADLHYVITPNAVGGDLLQGDFLRLLAYAVLLVGVWRAISHAEFGRAVAEERSRVAQDLHDGLAQYLFALSTHVSMLRSGAPLETVLPRLEEAALAAQQEARYAVLALSSAGGTAPFDAALRRYVEVLTADGALEVQLEIDPAVRLAADEQIEVFRIVQEGLANARRHAGARHAWVEVLHRGGRRVVIVRDDGAGFEQADVVAGQGLKGMRRRATSIDGGFALRSSPGRGTAIEVVLRAA